MYCPTRRSRLTGLLVILFSVTCLGILLSPHSPASAAEAADDQAREILDATNVRGGLIVHLSCGDGTLTAELGAGERYLVHGLDRDAAAVRGARAHIQSLGLYGRVAVEQNGDPGLRRTLHWSKAINASVADMVSGVPPFPFVRESIQKLHEQADILVVSATPQEALTREWEEHELTEFVVAICGQEIGTKAESLQAAARYPADHTLMIGDALGDYKAAVANNALFFPINPGDEEKSWKRFYEEGIDHFFGGTFAGEYQKQLLEEFDSYLPEKPPWPVEA